MAKVTSTARLLFNMVASIYNPFHFRHGSTFRRNFCGRNFRPQILQLFFRQRKHVIFGELIQIISDCFIHSFGLNTIKFCHVSIGHHIPLPYVRNFFFEPYRLLSVAMLRETLLGPFYLLSFSYHNG